MYKEKYLKYKTKYLELKNQLGGFHIEEEEIQISDKTFKFRYYDDNYDTFGLRVDDQSSNRIAVDLTSYKLEITIRSPQLLNINLDLFGNMTDTLTRISPDNLKIIKQLCIIASSIANNIMKRTGLSSLTLMSLDKIKHKLSIVDAYLTNILYPTDKGVPPPVIPFWPANW